ncbi:MAG: ATP-dependent RecD-like DNA helicase [Bacilli bacterium]|nr:ATP-dependent RecD-like DNA helicase [Bacilli bacterium]
MSYIKGKYTTEIFSNSDNGYTVGVIKIIDTDVVELKNKSSAYFVGTFIDLKLKNNYKMEGNLIIHKKYGVQFNVTNYENLLPEKKDELIEFLSSDLFPIGIKTAEKIVEKFKEKTIEVILDNPNSLLLIPRLNKDKIDKIYETLKSYQSTSEIVLELQHLGFNTKDSLSILNKYKVNSLDKINNNIYSLIDELDFNFNTIDEIALNNNYDTLDTRRISALIIHSLNELTFSNGDTYSFIEEIYLWINKYVEIDMEKLEYELIKLNKNGRIIIKDNRYYLKELYDAELYIKDRLCFLNDMSKRELPKLEEKLESLEKKNHIKYDDMQKKAIIKAINNNLTIITGGPGTGKTTIIKAIVSLLKDTCKVKLEDIALLAPTGRASKKMMESTGVSASTIHKYLGWDKERNMFRVDAYHPNQEDYIIVDETSMIDTVLMSSLLKGIKRDAKLILVGDYFQLPSVSQGQVLKDLIESEMLDVIKLNRLYRQNEDSYIINLAYEIKDKDLNEYFTNKKEDYNFIICDNDVVINNINEIVNKAISKGYDDKTIQVLAPMYKSINGIDNLNKSLQEIFNPFSPEKNEIIMSDVIYREGDKVLQLVNDPDNNVFNGDIGYIVSINNRKTMEVIIDYDGNYVTYPRDKFNNFRHGYAISIHKAQGSEFNMVIIPFVNSFKRMLYNKLVYTAVTRAKNKLILVGDPNSFIYGVKNDYIDNRKTTLKELIINNYKNV